MTEKSSRKDADGSREKHPSKGIPGRVEGSGKNVVVEEKVVAILRMEGAYRSPLRVFKSTTVGGRGNATEEWG